MAESQPFPGGVAVPENENASGALYKGEKKTVEMSKRTQNKEKKEEAL